MAISSHFNPRLPAKICLSLSLRFFYALVCRLVLAGGVAGSSLAHSAAMTIELTAAAAVGALPGPELNMLQRMHGRWLRSCYKSWHAADPVYRKDVITVSYTHFSFDTRLYSDHKCYQEVAQHTAKASYKLTGETFDVDGFSAFVFQLDPTILLPTLIDMPVTHIVSINGGKLYFGRRTEADARATKLNKRQPFLRF